MHVIRNIGLYLSQNNPKNVCVMEKMDKKTIDMDVNLVEKTELERLNERLFLNNLILSNIYRVLNFFRIWLLIMLTLIPIILLIVKLRG